MEGNGWIGWVGISEYIYVYIYIITSIMFDNNSEKCLCDVIIEQLGKYVNVNIDITLKYCRNC